MPDNAGYGYARKRAAHVVRAMLTGGASEDAAAHAGDRVFKGTLDVHTGARKAPAATAAHMTRQIRTAPESVAACRYADHRDVTGALHAPKMRVRRQGGGAPSDVCGPRMATPGVGAEQTIAARVTACAQLRTAIHTFRHGKSSAHKDAARSTIRTILHTWEGDADVRACALECGWRL